VVGQPSPSSGPTSLVQGATGTYAVSLTDSGGNGIAGQTVAMTSASGNTLTPASVVTGANARPPRWLTATNAGTDTVTATWQTMVGSQTVAVSGQNFAITAPAANALVQVAAAAPVTLTWTLAGSGGQSRHCYVTTSRGTVSPTSVTFHCWSGQFADYRDLRHRWARRRFRHCGSEPGDCRNRSKPRSTLSPRLRTRCRCRQPIRRAHPGTEHAGSRRSSTLPVNPVLGTTVDFSIQADTTGGSLSGTQCGNQRGRSGLREL